MIHVEIEEVFNASATKIWGLVGDFNGLGKIMPGVIQSRQEGEGVGSLRILSLPQNLRAIERLHALDPDQMKISYSVVESPMPVQNYLATMQVIPINQQTCRLKWFSDFEANAGVPEEKAKRMIEKAYRSAIDGLNRAISL